MDDLSFLGGDVVKAAQRLLGCHLVRTINNQKVEVRIVETEAYDQDDIASHSYSGKTNRNEVMFGPPGNLYVYFTYGMHYCCNVVVGPVGYGAAVLIRGAEIISGESLVKANRDVIDQSQLTNGPAKLCQALKIDKALNGHDLKASPLQLVIQPELISSKIAATKRIGLSKGQDSFWRFVVKDSSSLSRPYKS